VKRPIRIMSNLLIFAGRNLAKVGVEGSNPFARSKCHYVNQSVMRRPPRGGLSLVRPGVHMVSTVGTLRLCPPKRERINILRAGHANARCASLKVGRRSSPKAPRVLPRPACRIPIRSGRQILARAAPAYELHPAPDFGRACLTSSPCSTAAWMPVGNSCGSARSSREQK
jgi:hypothetical protein